MQKTCLFVWFPGQVFSTEVSTLSHSLGNQIPSPEILCKLFTISKQQDSKFYCFFKSRNIKCIKKTKQTNPTKFLHLSGFQHTTHPSNSIREIVQCILGLAPDTITEAFCFLSTRHFIIPAFFLLP